VRCGTASWVDARQATLHCLTAAPSARSWAWSSGRRLGSRTAEPSSSRSRSRSRTEPDMQTTPDMQTAPASGGRTGSWHQRHHSERCRLRGRRLTGGGDSANPGAVVRESQELVPHRGAVAALESPVDGPSRTRGLTALPPAGLDAAHGVVPFVEVVHLHLDNAGVHHSIPTNPRSNWSLAMFLSPGRVRVLTPRPSAPPVPRPAPPPGRPAPAPPRRLAGRSRGRPWPVGPRRRPPPMPRRRAR
jgi:hypothetical protein